MKRKMMWLFPHPVEKVDEKGKTIKDIEFREEPLEGVKPQMVAVYRTKEQRNA